MQIQTKIKTKMQILNENDKLNVVLTKGTEENFPAFRESIISPTMLYLCRSPFVPISEDIAGYIYFLRKLSNDIQYIPRPGKKVGSYVWFIPRNEADLPQILTDAIDSTIEDFLSYVLATRMDRNVIEAVQFLNTLRKSFSPSFDASKELFIAKKDLRTNPKGRVEIKKGTEQDLMVYRKSIISAIDFYLCRTPFITINADKAGNIFFLQKLLDNIQFVFEQVGDLGNIVCSVPNYDMELLQIWVETIDSTIQDILAHGLETNNSRNYIQMTHFLNELRRALAPSIHTDNTNFLHR